MKKSDSIYKEAWKKLKKDNAAKLGMFFILILVIVTVAGPLIRPDNSTDADEQILQIKSQSPGFKINLLYKRHNRKEVHTSLVDGIIGGYSSNYMTPIPIVDYWFEGSDLVCVRFMGSATLIDTVRESLADICYALDYDNREINKNNGILTFQSLKGAESISIKDLQDKVTNDHMSTKTFWLGTDRNGRDFLSRIMAGTRVSLGVGLIAVTISIFLGVILGALAGYFRGWVDDVITWVISVFWSIPALLLVIAITLSFGKGIEVVFVAVGFTMWVEVARIVRGQFLSLSQYEFVEAGRALGFGNRRIIFKHILPNIVGPVIVVAVSNFATAILLESGLSFLGLGAQPPQASWGEMVGTYSGYLIGDNPHLALVPGAAIVITVIAFFMLGNGLRDAFDIRSVNK
jgi:peptide/nickel transport system permease protein